MRLFVKSLAIFLSLVNLVNAATLTITNNQNISTGAALTGTGGSIAPSSGTGATNNPWLYEFTSFTDGLRFSNQTNKLWATGVYSSIIFDLKGGSVEPNSGTFQWGIISTSNNLGHSGNIFLTNIVGKLYLSSLDSSCLFQDGNQGNIYISQRTGSVNIVSIKSTSLDGGDYNDRNVNFIGVNCSDLVLGLVDLRDLIYNDNGGICSDFYVRGYTNISVSTFYGYSVEGYSTYFQLGDITNPVLGTISVGDIVLSGTNLANSTRNSLGKISVNSSNNVSFGNITIGSTGINFRAGLGLPGMRVKHKGAYYSENIMSRYLSSDNYNANLEINLDGGDNSGGCSVNLIDARRTVASDAGTATYGASIAISNYSSVVVERDINALTIAPQDRNGGTVVITNINGNITLGNSLPMGCSNSLDVSSARNGNAGYILVSTTNGSISILGNIKATSDGTGNGGTVSIVAPQNITLNGCSLNLDAPSNSANEGSASLITTGGIITVANVNLDVVNTILINPKTNAYFTRTLLNMATNRSGGTGTFADPYVTTQTSFRLPSSRVAYYYNSTPSNDYLNFATYKLADEGGVAGNGGILTAGTTNYTWTNTTVGYWTNAGNWFPNGVPTESDWASFTSSVSDYTCILDTTVNVSRVTMSNNIGNVYLVITNGGVFTNNYTYLNGNSHLIIYTNGLFTTNMVGTQRITISKTNNTLECYNSGIFRSASNPFYYDKGELTLKSDMRTNSFQFGNVAWAIYIGANPVTTNTLYYHSNTLNIVNCYINNSVSGSDINIGALSSGGGNYNTLNVYTSYVLNAIVNIGQSGSNNNMYVSPVSTNAPTAVNCGAVSGDSNTLTVVGNIEQRTSGALVVGNTGSKYNTIIVTNGGRIIVAPSGSVNIGSAANTIKNGIIVTGSNTVLDCSARTVVIGSSAGGLGSNYIIVANSAIAGDIGGSARNFIIGQNTPGNYVIVTNAGSILINNACNMIVGATNGANNNQLILDGVDTAVNPGIGCDLLIGNPANVSSASNQVIIRNGAVMQEFDDIILYGRNSSITLHDTARASANSALYVTPSSSGFTNSIQLIGNDCIFDASFVIVTGANTRVIKILKSVTNDNSYLSASYISFGYGSSLQFGYTGITPNQIPLNTKFSIARGNITYDYQNLNFIKSSVGNTNGFIMGTNITSGIGELFLQYIGKQSTKTIATSDNILGYRNELSPQIINPTISGIYYYEMPITFSGYNKGERLTNFTALVTLSNNINNSAFNYGGFISGGWDLRFYDSTGTNELQYEIEKWDPTMFGTSYVWVKVPAISNSTDYITMKWGNYLFTNQAIYTTDGTAWNTNYRTVYHLSTDSFNTDSTTNANFATVSGYTETNSIIDGAKKLSGTSSSKIYGLTKIINTARATVSALVKLNSNSSYNRSIVTTLEGTNKSVYDKTIYVDNNNKPYFYVFAPTAIYTPDPLITLDTNTWYLLHGTADGTTARLYVNGVQVSSVLAGNTFAAYTVPNFYIGDNFGVGTVFTNYNGIVDEARISNMARSSNWVWYESMNILSNTTFQTYGRAIRKRFN